MTPIKLLLSRPSALRGLGLIATMSALSGPLCLEILFNHADLWFSGAWQDEAFDLIWGGWTITGVLICTSWGLDRGFSGITPEIHQRYSLILSVLGVMVYLGFSLPLWVWLYTMRLTDLSHQVVTLFSSACILLNAAVLASWGEQRVSALFGLTFGLGAGILTSSLIFWVVGGA